MASVGMNKEPVVEEVEEVETHREAATKYATILCDRDVGCMATLSATLGVICVSLGTLVFIEETGWPNVQGLYFCSFALVFFILSKEFMHSALGRAGVRADSGKKRNRTVRNFFIEGPKHLCELRKCHGLNDPNICGIRPTWVKKLLAVVLLMQLVLNASTITYSLLTCPKRDAYQPFNFSRIAISHLEFFYFWSLLFFHFFHFTKASIGLLWRTPPSVDAMAHNYVGASHFLKKQVIRFFAGFSVICWLPASVPTRALRDIKRVYDTHASVYRKVPYLIYLFLFAKCILEGVQFMVSTVGVFLKMQSMLGLFVDSSGLSRHPYEWNHWEMLHFLAFVNQLGSMTNLDAAEMQQVLLTFFTGEDRIEQTKERLSEALFLGFLVRKFFFSYGFVGGMVMILTFDAADLQMLMVVDTNKIKTEGDREEWISPLPQMCKKIKFSEGQRVYASTNMSLGGGTTIMKNCPGRVMKESISTMYPYEFLVQFDGLPDAENVWHADLSDTTCDSSDSEFGDFFATGEGSGDEDRLLSGDDSGDDSGDARELQVKAQACDEGIEPSGGFDGAFGRFDDAGGRVWSNAVKQRSVGDDNPPAGVAAKGHNPQSIWSHDPSSSVWSNAVRTMTPSTFFRHS